MVQPVFPRAPRTPVLATAAGITWMLETAMSSSRVPIPSKAELMARAQACPLVTSAPLLDVATWAGVYGVSLPTAYRLIKAGQVTVTRIGRSIRIRNPLLEAK